MSATYRHAAPFQHVVVEDFLERGAAERLCAEYPELNAVQRSIARILEARSYDGELSRFGPAFQSVYDDLQSEHFTAWLRRLTGIEDLVMDPELVGGGVHQGARGSSLHVHADHNTHPDDPTRYRRINVLVYLNHTWNSSWGGDLELYDAAGASVVKKVVPVFNRCIIMDVHDRAFHGYRVLRVPAGTTRKTLAAYYYSRTPGPLQSVEGHPTLLGVPHESYLPRYALARMRRSILNRLPIAGLRPRPRR